MEQKHDLRMKRTCQMLSYALFSLLTKKAYEDIRIDELCQKAYIHRTTFYHYFNNKEDLFTYAIDEVKEQIFEELQTHVHAHSSIEEGFLKLAEITIHFLYEKKVYIEQIIKHNQTQPIMHILADNITRSIRFLFIKNRKHFSVLKIDKDVLAQFLAGGCIQIALWWLTSKTPITEKELYENVKILMMQQTYFPLN